MLPPGLLWVGDTAASSRFSSVPDRECAPFVGGTDAALEASSSFLRETFLSFSCDASSEFSSSKELVLSFFARDGIFASAKQTRASQARVAF